MPPQLLQLIERAGPVAAQQPEKPAIGEHPPAGLAAMPSRNAVTFSRNRARASADRRPAHTSSALRVAAKSRSHSSSSPWPRAARNSRLPQRREPRRSDPCPWNTCSPWRALDIRTCLSDHKSVKGAEFERRVQKLAKAKALSCFFIADKGKGSHGRLYLGTESTTLKDRKKELGKGLLARMCRDLRIDAEEL